MGYDALFFKDIDDDALVRIALSQNRVVLTKDRQILKRRVVMNGKLKAILVTDDDPKVQLVNVIKQLDLNCNFKPFSLCLECNEKLVKQSKDQVHDRVPQHVFKTQADYMECPACHRVYWQGTHWDSMRKELERLTSHNLL
jgi:uncharacterized protein with PIN domain